MKFERTEEYESKLFSEAFFDEKKVIRDAEIVIDVISHKFKAYCIQSQTYLQFPRHLRSYSGQRFMADVVEVIRADNVTKYYRAMKGSIRKLGSEEVVG